LRERFWQNIGIENTYLSLEEIIPNNQAHVYGDNFNNDGSNIDLTFLPRASHESITYGSSGLFMTAKNLAKWSHALFEGEILQQKSMDEMLKFEEFRAISNMRAYGLGVQVFTRDLSSGKEAIGHSGGNIGTTAYMVYLPEYHVSVAVMVNAFPNKSAEAIIKGLIRTILNELYGIGYIPYVEFFPTGFIMICGTLSLITMLIFRKKKNENIIG
jgi:CubicO group peptidase (beta-lactamase class C family)